MMAALYATFARKFVLAAGAIRDVRHGPVVSDGIWDKVCGLTPSDAVAAVCATGQL